MTVCILVLGLLLNGCATSRDVQMVDGRPCPQDTSHSSWFREHPVLIGAATGLLVVGGILTAGYLALKAAGPGMQGGSERGFAGTYLKTPAGSDRPFRPHRQGAVCLFNPPQAGVTASMPRSFLVGLLVFGLFLSGCAGSPHAAQSTASQDAVAIWNPPPRESEHSFRDWCRAHPVMTGAVTGLLVVAGGVLVLGAVSAAASSSIHEQEKRTEWPRGCPLPLPGAQPLRPARA